MNTALPQRWMERLRALALHPRVPDAVAIVLVALLGWQVAAVTWMILPPTEAATLPEPEITAPASSRSADSVASPTARLARLHLFGDASKKEKQDTPDQQAGGDADAPETQLNLTLKGVYAPGSGNGIAIISVGGGPEKVFAVGDTVAGNARITGIYSDRVALRRGGRAETLRLDLADDETNAAQSSSRRRSGSNVPDRETLERARELREELLDSPLALARVVRFQPYREGGQLKGFRLHPRSGHGELLRGLGIRRSDVVTRINDIPLDSRENGNRALQALRNADTVRVTLERNGRERRVTIPLDQSG